MTGHVKNTGLAFTNNECLANSSALKPIPTG